MCDPLVSDIPLPSGRPKNVKSAVLHIISLAHYAIVAARGWAANSINARVRLAAENDRLKQQIELLRQEIDGWAGWFNERRPHTALAGKTPDEVYRRIAPANKRPRWEPSKRWPPNAGCADPKAENTWRSGRVL